MRGSPTRLVLAAACVASGLITAACAMSAPAFLGPNSDLSGTRWIVRMLNGDPISEARAPQLAFGAQDRLTGSGGCNNLSAIYETDNGNIDVRALGATERACDNSVMRQEAAFIALLADATRYARDGERLVITAENGANVVLIPAT